MLIGVPKEIKDHETRVGLSPEGVRALCADGHEVQIENGAGARVGFPDSAYLDAGAHVVSDAEAVFACDMLVKVKELQPAEFQWLRQGQILFGFHHLAPDRALLERMLAAKVACVAYETVSDAQGRLPLLAPMSQIAGRLSIQVGAWALQVPNGGSGVLLSGTDGVAPAKVVIIGAGVVGSNAAQIALGLGAQVTVLDVSRERLARLDQTHRGKLQTCLNEPAALAAHITDTDLIVGASQVSGKRAPKILTRELLRQMRPGSVLVDVAIDQGGIAETSRPTSHSNPIYLEEGVVHYCVTNIPALVARTATLALTRATFPYVKALANLGLKKALSADAGLKNGLQIHAGHITYKNLAEDVGKPYVPPEQALA